MHWQLFTCVLVILLIMFFICLIDHKKSKKPIIHSWLNDFQYHLRRKITDHLHVTRSKLIELLYSIQFQSIKAET